MRALTYSWYDSSSCWLLSRANCRLCSATCSSLNRSCSPLQCISMGSIRVFFARTSAYIMHFGINLRRRRIAPYCNGRRWLHARRPFPLRLRARLFLRGRAPAVLTRPPQTEVSVLFYEQDRNLRVSEGAYLPLPYAKWQGIRFPRTAAACD